MTLLDRILDVRELSLWHPESPGMRVRVYRSRFGRWIKPKCFATLSESIDAEQITKLNRIRNTDFFLDLSRKKTMTANKVLFSVNDYDADGDVMNEGVFLHFGDTTRIKVAKNLSEFDAFVQEVLDIRKELKLNYS